MSSTGPSYHIPFPSAFLSLNSPLKRSASIDGTSNATLHGVAPVHNFLSNRPAVPRHSSVSSISSTTSTDSARSAPSSPPSQTAAAPVPAQEILAFLPLNSKFAAPQAGARQVNANKDHTFLSNKH